MTMEQAAGALDTARAVIGMCDHRTGAPGGGPLVTHHDDLLLWVVSPTIRRVVPARRTGHDDCIQPGVATGCPTLFGATHVYVRVRTGGRQQQQMHKTIRLTITMAAMYPAASTSTGDWGWGVGAMRGGAW